LRKADDRVERSLYQRAVGHTFETVKIFCSGSEVTHVAPVRRVAVLQPEDARGHTRAARAPGTAA
jgi:hypothetical protein